MPYAKDHKERTRRRILQSARRQFSAKGFDATSIEDVMRDCALTRGGFYAHFSSKAALYREAMTADSAPSRDGHDEFQAFGRELLDSVFQSCVARQLDGHGTNAALAFLATDVAAESPEVRAAYTAALKAFIRNVRHVPDGEGCSEQSALAATAVAVGALAVAVTTDDELFKTRFIRACAKHANATIEVEYEKLEDRFLWAVDASADVLPLLSGTSR